MYCQNGLKLSGLSDSGCINQWFGIYLVTGNKQSSPKLRPGLIVFDISMNNPDDNTHRKPDMNGIKLRKNWTFCGPPDCCFHKRNLMSNVGSPEAYQKGNVGALRVQNLLALEDSRLLKSHIPPFESCCWRKISTEVLIQVLEVFFRFC